MVQPLRSRPLWGWWLLARTPGVLSLVVGWPHHYVRREASDVNLYRQWSSYVAHGLLPYRDFRVEYPPGVMPVMELRPLHAASFRIEFVALAVIVDALVLNALSRRPEHRRGCWVWIAAPVALGSIEWARLDIFVAAALVAAVLAFEREHDLRAGAWLGFAALIKLWPLALVVAFVAILPGRRGRAILGGTGATLVAFTVPVLAWGGWSGLRWMLGDQLGRGVQVESLPAVPLMLARQAGASERVVFAHGASEVQGPWATGLAVASTAVMLLALLALVIFLRARQVPAGAASAIALIVVMVVIMTGKVLSPQYMVWAVAAVAVSIDSIDRPRLLFGWTMGALAVTQLEYPLLYWTLARHGWRGTTVAVVHGAAVLGFALVAITRGLATCEKPRSVTGASRAVSGTLSS
jgi:hypothetical protein